MGHDMRINPTVILVPALIYINNGDLDSVAYESNG